MTDQPTITPNPDGDGVIIHLPWITYLDTQPWAVDIGLTTAGLDALRALLTETPRELPVTTYPPGPIGAALRPRAIDALGQALNRAGYWLPVDGRPIAADAVLALVSPEACCACDGGPVTYRNYRDLPFCQPCADGQPALSARGQYAAQIEAAIGLNVDCGGTAGVYAVRDAVLAARDTELDTARRRAVTLQTRLDAARHWARQNLTPEQQTELLAALRGGPPKETPDA